MTRLQLNRTVWAGLTLFLLSITPMTLNADEPSPTDSARQLIEQHQQQKEKEKQLLLEKEIQPKQLQVELIQEEITVRTGQLRATRNMLVRLTEKLSNTYSSLSKEDRSKLIGNAIQSLQETRTSIAVNKNLIAHLEKSLKTAEPPAIQRLSADAKMQTLKKQYQLAQVNEKMIAASVEAAASSRREAIHVQIECEQIKAKLIEAELGKAALLEIAKKPIADKIAALKTELIGLNIKSAITEEYLQTLSSSISASTNTDIQGMQYEIDSLQQQIQLWQKKLNEIQLEICLLDAKR